MKNYIPHVSVDCVLIGFDGTQLNVLLVEKTENGTPSSGECRMKLPGRLIQADESLEQAAADTLESMTGIRKSNLQQFRTFGAPDRTSNREDLEWLEGQVSLKLTRILTVGFMSTLRISTRLHTFSPEFHTRWCPVDSVPRLIFDHNHILEEALLHLKQMVKLQPALLFKLLPAQFTALELRKIYETIDGKPIDARNFHKKITSKPYVKLLPIKQTNVAHRAARYYTFDKRSYNKLYAQV